MASIGSHSESGRKKETHVVGTHRLRKLRGKAQSAELEVVGSELNVNRPGVMHKQVPPVETVPLS